MSFYAKRILPSLIDLAMKNPGSARLRAKWIPRASGDVLEVGIGSGLNLPFYSTDVRHLYGVDPSLELQEIARKRLAALPLQAEFILQSAEFTLPLAASSIDTAVLTWTLCSIPDAQSALQELKRVLRPGGRLIFLEHGRAPDAGVAGWQDRLTPLWRRFSGGCHLNRTIDRVIEGSGFRITELTTGYLTGPRPLMYTYEGLAVPR